MKRCPQCWLFKPARAFRRHRGQSTRPTRICEDCRSQSGPDGYRSRGRPIALIAQQGLRIGWAERSGNSKTGPIPVSISAASTCPPSCALYGAGCYAEYGWTRTHWIDAGEEGIPWKAFLRRVRLLPPGQLWRHNEAGDLAGVGERLDLRKLAELVAANATAQARGFTFTHKRLERPEERRAVRDANTSGFTINLSAETLKGADRLARRGIGPVVVLLPHNAPDGSKRTPAGRHVVVCPAQTSGLTCADCRLCANATRKCIVGFRAHGQMAGRVGDVIAAASLVRSRA